MGGVDNEDDVDEKEAEQQEEVSNNQKDKPIQRIGLITNLKFLKAFITEYLAHYKLIKKYGWINSNDVMLIIILRILDLLLAGVKLKYKIYPCTLYVFLRMPD